MAIIGVALAIIATTSVAGTLAAFNATYTWQSDSAVTGDFGFSDTTYRLSLFGDDGIILPDESGKSVLSGPAFGDVPVTWSFAADNPSGIPVVFYLASADGSVDYSTAFCSGYDFSQLASYYVKGAYGESIPLAEVSGDLTELVSALSVGKTLCWTWPYRFYSDAECTAEADTEQTDEYKAYCESLCVGAYEFPVAVANALSEHTVGYAAAGNDDEFSVVPCSDKTRLTHLRRGFLHSRNGERPENGQRARRVRAYQLLCAEGVRRIYRSGGAFRYARNVHNCKRYRDT